MRIAGESRNVPRRQREEMHSTIDNYIDNNRFHGNPNLTDETDVFSELYKDDKARNSDAMKRHSIQEWNDR